MRVIAHTPFSEPDRRRTFTSLEKSYYTSAFEHYQKSLAALGERKSFPEVWDHVTWQLSGAYYTMGTLVQDSSLEESDADTVSVYILIQYIYMCELNKAN